VGVAEEEQVGLRVAHLKIYCVNSSKTCNADPMATFGHFNATRIDGVKILVYWGPWCISNGSDLQHPVLDESSRQLLGQCHGGELLCHAKNGIVRKGAPVLDSAGSPHRDL
jgi:hypothetical protein